MKRLTRKTRLNLDIPVVIKQRAKEKAVRENKTLTEVIERLLLRWIEDRPSSKRRPLRLKQYDLGLADGRIITGREVYEDLS